MRPLEYRDYLVSVLKDVSGVQHVKAVENGPYPFAVIATVAGRDLRWQVIGQLADGAKQGVSPVRGAPPGFTVAPVTGPPDAWLASVIGGAEPTDTERIDVWSSREPQPPSQGLTVSFFNGERVFVRLV
jgi:hypothetical protein